MIPEAPLEPAGKGMAPAADGWFVLSVSEARWVEGTFGAVTPFEGTNKFPHLGINTVPRC